MLVVPVEIRKSEIHGQGVFALRDIKAGSVIWIFDHLDQRWDRWVVENFEDRLMNFVQERGYVNHKNQVVLPSDEAQFLNFPPRDQAANLRLGGLMDGEYCLIAELDIQAGTELTVPPNSDADYERKMARHASVR